MFPDGIETQHKLHLIEQSGLGRVSLQSLLQPGLAAQVVHLASPGQQEEDVVFGANPRCRVQSGDGESYRAYLGLTPVVV